MYAPTTTEQRAEIYEDVYELLVPGFITHPVKVGRYNFVLRSFFPSEYQHLQMRVGVDSTDREYKNWALAMSICMVDGQIFIADQQCIKVLYKTLSQLPGTMVEILFSILMGLLNRSRRVVDMVEAYSYEDSSRLLWLKMGEKFVNTSGYEGVERLGRTTHQMMWTALNKYEDTKIARLNQMEGFKLVAATHSPKEIQRMSEKDQKELMDETASRNETMDLAYYKFHNYEIAKRDLEIQSEKQGNRRQKTVQSLEGEYESWVKGEVDFHDSVVNAQNAQIKQKMEESIRREQKQRKALNAEGGFYVPSGAVDGIVAYSDQQMQSLLAKSNKGRIPGTQSIPEDVYEDQLHVYRKFLVNTPVPPAPKTVMQMQEPLDEQVEARRRSLK